MSESRKRILWIDNDISHILPYKVALEEDGYEVTIVQTVSEGAQRLTREQFDLVVLDVMIPVTEDEESGDYPPKDTDETHETGLVFYKLHKELLLRKSIPLIAMTVRLDQGIADEFVKAGLPAACFVRKFEVRDVDIFLDKIRSTVR